MKPIRNMKWLMLAIALIVQTVAGSLAYAEEAPAQPATGDAAAPPVASMLGTVQITGGVGFTVALRNDGTVWTWGDNMRGKLGNGASQASSRSFPGQVPGLTDVVAVAAGMYHTLALKKDGSVWAWGQNTSGQLGTGNTNDSAVPVQVEGLYHIVSIAAGAGHSVALDQFGNVYEWGDNLRGQLGDGTTDPKLKPIQVPGVENIKAIASGSSHVVVLMKNNQLMAWGDNTYGQLGYGTSGDYHSKPIISTFLGDVVYVATGNNFTIALTEFGTMWSWGSNAKGQLANGNQRDSVKAGLVMAGNDIVKVSTGSTHAIALRKDGTVMTWGAGNLGQLGSGSGDNSVVPVALQLRDVADIGTGAFHTMVIKKDGTVLTWGNNLMGQLGDGTTTTRNAPVTIPRFTLDVSKVQVPASGGDKPLVQAKPGTIAAGESQTLAIKDGQLWGWGENNFGQLGDGTTINKNEPVAAGHPGPFVTASVSTNHTAAVTADGSLYTWGLNLFGQLGDGSTANKNGPGAAPVLTGVSQAATGNAFTAALKKDGSVWMTGDNLFGQLADPVATNRSTFAKIEGLPPIVQIEAGFNHILALDVEGGVWAWGDNSNGQLGDGTTSPRKAVNRITLLTDIVAVQAGKLHSLALKKDGTVWAWGYNAFGQLGDGTTTSRTSPTLASISDVQSLSAGSNHTLALKKDGTVWAWGFGSFGQLGSGAAGNEAKPVQVAGLAGATEIAAGGNHSAALAANGDLSVWGANFSGQLGDGTFANKLSPAAVTGINAPVSASVFSDLKGHWAASLIAQAANKGYVDGYKDNTFRPDERLTRAEFAKMAASALKLKTEQPQPNQPWYQPYVDALTAASIYGKQETAGDWNAPITRLEIARVAERAIDPANRKPDTTLENGQVMLAAVQIGLLQGLQGGSLGPDEPTTRAQSITLIERMLTVKQGGTLEVDREALAQAQSSLTASGNR